MFEQLFNQWLEHQQENQFQLGCHDRDAGFLPRFQGSDYLKGYLSNRPDGLDNVVQYFSTISGYLEWKRHSSNC